MSIKVVKTQDHQQRLEVEIKNHIFLIVDDFDSMRKATINQLRQLGATRLYEAANGAEALKVLAKQPITIILSDWNMPVMNGLDLLLTVRSTPELFRLPFMMITSEADRERVTQAIQIGVSQLLVKPYTAGRLAERLSVVFKWQPRHNQPIDPIAVSEALGIELQNGSPLRATAPKKLELLDLDSMPHDDQEVVSDAPVSRVTPQPAPRKPRAVQEKRKPTILIVDDTPDNLTLLAHIFNTEYRVKIAHRGDKAIQICQSDDPPDMVLLDVMMPEMDGFEVAEQLRGHPASEQIPIIFVTALTDEASRQKGLSLGAVDFVTKPVDPVGLKIKVQNFMRYIELHRELQNDYDNMLQMDRLKADVEHITRHDMKAPLSGVIGLAQSLVDAPNLTVDQREQIRLIEDTAVEVLNMFNLSNEILKIEAGRFELKAKEVDVLAILKRTVEPMRKTFAVKSLNIKLEMATGVHHEQLMAWGDPMLCYSVFQNLLKNACEAAPDQTDIHILVENRGNIFVRIRNKGVVPASIRENFFGKFVTAGKSEGTGLGTYSAKLLTEAQNGRVSMETHDADNTTCMTVELPVKPGQPTG